MDCLLSPLICLSEPVQQTTRSILWLWQGDWSLQHRSLKSCSAGTRSNERTLLSGQQLGSPFQTGTSAQ